MDLFVVRSFWAAAVSLELEFSNSLVAEGSNSSPSNGIQGYFLHKHVDF